MARLASAAVVVACGLLLGISPNARGEGAESADPGTVHLFNGRNLDGFHTFIKERGRNVDPLNVFTVQDGVLRISGEEWGCVTSEAEYENYRLIVEFKWGEKAYPPRVGKARDSGVLLHSIGADGAYGGIWMNSIECQLIEGGTGDFIVVGDGSDKFAITCPVAAEKSDSCYVYKSDGQPATINAGRVNWFGRDPAWRDEFGFRGKQDVEKPAGEWNRYECIADGSTITLILNGVTVNRCVDARPRKGRIQIQSEGAEIMFRRVDIVPLDEKKEADKDGARKRRFIYNCDADNMFIYKPYPMQPADVFGYVDEISNTGVTTLFMSPNVGMNVNFPGKVNDMLGTHLSPALAETIKDPAATKPISLERAAVNFKSLVDAGHDPLGLIVQHAKEKGLEVLVSFRLNEVHAVDEKDSVLLSRFWKEHPEWHIGKPGDKLSDVYVQILGPRTSPIVGSWLPGGLNFAVSEVREQRLAELRECCERYPIDGLDLDFQRFPMYFPPGKEVENVVTMTDWMRKVRRMTREIAEKRGRPLLLTARIMAKPEQNLAIGLDPVTWAKEGLVDFVTVSHYLRNDFPLSVAEYRRVLPSNMPVYASIEVEPSKDTYRRMARWLWQDGTDGIMLFNFFTTREGGKEPPFELLNELGDSKKLPPDEDVLLVLNKHEDTMSFVNPRTLEPIAKIPTGPNPHEIVLSADRRFAYLSNYAPPGNTVSVINLVERKHPTQISTGEYSRIHGAAIAPPGKRAYFTAGQTGFVVEIDTQTNAVTRGIPTHGEISHMVLVSPDGKRLYTANINSQNVSVIDRESGALITQIPCGKGCEGMACTPDRKQLWALNQEAGSITIIDLATHTATKTIPCPGMPVRVRFTLDGRRALVSSWTEKGELVVIDVATLTEIKRLPVGSRAIGLELSPDGKRAFVGCEETDGVHVIDLETLSVTGKFFTGNGSDSMVWWVPPR